MYGLSSGFRHTHTQVRFTKARKFGIQIIHEWFFQMFRLSKNLRAEYFAKKLSNIRFARNKNLQISRNKIS